MKKFIKRSIFITIAMLLIFTIKSYAQVTVEGKQEYRQDAYLTVKSTESIENIKIYKKTEENRFILFYKATPNNKETICRVSSKLLSEEKETIFKIVVLDKAGEYSYIETTIDKIQKMTTMKPGETAKPTTTSSPIPTKPTPTTTSATTSSATSTSTTTSSAASTSTTSGDPTSSSSSEPSTSASEGPSPSTSGEDNNGQHQYSKAGSVINQYSDETIKVSVEKINTFYVTKIWIKDSSMQIKKAEAGWGKELKTVNNMLNASTGAIIGCNGSGFYKSGSWSPSQSEIKKTKWDKTTEGYLVLTNGEVRREIEGQKTNALLGILPRGGFKYFENSPYKDVKNDGVKNTFTFGPMLVYDGKAYKQQVGTPRRTDVNTKKYLTSIGQVDSNNYVIIAAKSQSTLNDAAKLGISLDCKMLYNLDGGGSSTVWFRNATSGQGTQIKSSSRAVGDALYFISTK